jgi:hypothetical protein
VGCGGDDDGGEDPAEVLRESLTQDTSYESGVINIALDASLEGETNGSIDADVSGPFQGGTEGQTPEVALDATATVNAEGLPQLPGGTFSFDFDGGFALAEDSLFVTYQGTTYEASQKLYSQISPLLETAESASESTTDPESVDPLIEALDNLENEGTEDVEGESTVHVSGDVDFASLLEQQEGAAALPEQATQVFENLDASLDYFAAEEDKSFRRIDFSLALDEVPEELSAQGFEGLDFTISVGISDPNSEQTIEAPTGETRPLDDLLGQFGASEQQILQGLQQGLGSVPGTLPGAGGGLGTPGGAASDPQVQECIANAADADAITECLNQ